MCISRPLKGCFSLMKKQPFVGLVIHFDSKIHIPFPPDAVLCIAFAWNVFRTHRRLQWKLSRINTCSKFFAWKWFHYQCIASSVFKCCTILAKHDRISCGCWIVQTGSCDKRLLSMFPERLFCFLLPHKRWNCQKCVCPLNFTAK